MGIDEAQIDSPFTGQHHQEQVHRTDYSHKNVGDPASSVPLHGGHARPDEPATIASGTPSLSPTASIKPHKQINYPKLVKQFCGRRGCPEPCLQWIDES